MMMLFQFYFFFSLFMMWLYTSHKSWTCTCKHFIACSCYLSSKIYEEKKYVYTPQNVQTSDQLCWLYSSFSWLHTWSPSLSLKIYIFVSTPQLWLWIHNHFCFVAENILTGVSSFFYVAIHAVLKEPKNFVGEEEKEIEENLLVEKMENCQELMIIQVVAFV